MTSKIESWFTSPIDNAILAYWRMAFGVLMVWEIIHEFTSGNVRHVWVLPEMHFKYLGFGWIDVWPGVGMYVHFAVLGVLALMIALGLFYRISIVVFFLGFTFAFLTEKAAYQNHLYLISLISFIMCFVPAHRRWSLDVMLKRATRIWTSPNWALLLIRFQFAVVYVYGGVAKINPDWLGGEPVRMWLSGKTDVPFIGSVADYEATVAFVAYGGLVFDLLVVPLLLWRRTRWFAIAASVFFHVTNNFVFTIGIFPWLAMAALPLFLPPELTGRWLAGLRSRVGSTRTEVLAGDDVAHRLQRFAMWGVIGFMITQVVIPLRQYVYPGNQSWTEEAHFFSWRMMLRDKRIASQVVTVMDPEQSDKPQIVRLRDYFEQWQAKNMLESPDMIHQFALHLGREHARRHGKTPEVFADVFVSLNGRAPVRLIDPSRDLARQPRTLWPSDWIMPLEDRTP